MTRSCPKCGGAMARRNVGAVEIEECGACKGIWFEREELRRAKDATDADLSWMDFQIWKHPDQFTLKPSPLQCPGCKTPLKTVRYGSTGVEVDCCPACHGTWLDEGEFEKIIQSLEHEVSQTSFSEYVRDALREARELITGDESLASEWRDFTTVLRLMQRRLLVEHPNLMSALRAVQDVSPFR